MVHRARFVACLLVLFSARAFAQPYESFPVPQSGTCSAGAGKVIYSMVGDKYVELAVAAKNDKFDNLDPCTNAPGLEDKLYARYNGCRFVNPSKQDKEECCKQAIDYGSSTWLPYILCGRSAADCLADGSTVATSIINNYCYTAAVFASTSSSIAQKRAKVCCSTMKTRCEADVTTQLNERLTAGTCRDGYGFDAKTRPANLLSSGDALQTLVDSCKTDLAAIYACEY